MKLDVCTCGTRDCVGSGPAHDQRIDENYIVNKAGAAELRYWATHGRTVSIRELARREIQRRTDDANRKGGA